MYSRTVYFDAFGGTWSIDLTCTPDTSVDELVERAKKIIIDKLNDNISFQVGSGRS